MRKYLAPITIGVLALTTALTSCKKDNEDLSGLSTGEGYYPLEIGKYVLYNVDSTYWDDFLRTELVYTSQVRYQTADTFRNAAGELSYKIDVFQRKQTTDSFELREVFYATRTNNSIEVNQKNLTFIKLVFPVLDGKTWNGNAKVPISDQMYSQEFDNPNWLYTYHKADRPFDPGNNNYEHTVTVNQIDDQFNNPDVDSSAYAYRNYSQEVYALNVGLVYRERIYWVFQPKSPDGQSGGSGYRKGYGVRMRAIENN